MGSIPDNNGYQFVPTGQIFDVQEMQQKELSNSDLKELLIRLYQNINNMGLVINAKGNGQHLTTEVINSEEYFATTTDINNSLRSVYRKVINFGALAVGVNTKPHGLTIGTTWSFVRIYGAASNTTTNKYYPIPDSNITLSLDATNINITNSSTFAFTVSTIVLEYLKN